MKILVTGATGFIGERFVESVLSQGHEVYCLVRKTSSVDLLEKAGVPLVVADITVAEEVERIFSEVRPESAVHCAADVDSGDENVLREVNIRGTENVCRACLKYCADRLVYLSSVSVVSGNRAVPLTDDLPYKASSSYGRSKIEAEKVVIGYRDRGLRAAVIRPCMVYGEDEPHAMDNILRMVSRKLLPVFSLPELKDRLHLVHVDNVVQSMRLALEKDAALEGTFIIADREIISIREFIEILSDELGAGRPFVLPGWLVRAGLVIPFMRKKAGRIFKDRVYDISRAVDVLGFDPATSTEDGLRRTARYWKQKRERCQK